MQELEETLREPPENQTTVPVMDAHPTPHPRLIPVSCWDEGVGIAVEASDEEMSIATLGIHKHMDDPSPRGVHQ